MITQNLSTLKIHKLTQEQYDRELAAGRIDENALYLTPDEEIDLTPYATKEEVAAKADAEHSHEISDVTDLQSTLDVMEDELRGYTDTKIADLINSAPTTLDTLGEIADAMEENADVVEALDNAIGTKANASTLTEHVNDKENPHEVTLAHLGVTVASEEINKLEGVTTDVQTQIDETNSKLPTCFDIETDASGKFILTDSTYDEINSLVTAGVSVCLVHRSNGEQRTYHFFNKDVNGTMYFYWHNSLYFNRMILTSAGALSETWWSLVTTNNNIGRAGTGSYAEIFNSYTYNKASGSYSHAEGRNTVASGSNGSHAEGYLTWALGESSHAEGVQTVASGVRSHSEGYGRHYVYTITGNANATTYQIDEETVASDVQFILYNNKIFTILSCDTVNKTVEVDKTLSESALSAVDVRFICGGVAAGSYSHNEGFLTTASGEYSHAEGESTIASKKSSHAEGTHTTASGMFSHAEGYYTSAMGQGCHAEGGSNSSTFSREIVIDSDTTVTIQGSSAYNIYSHAEGMSTLAYGTAAHSEGAHTSAVGGHSHAEGRNTIARGHRAHTEGDYTIGSSNDQHVQGKYNIEDTDGLYAHIVGNGTAEEDRSNAHTLDWSGNAWYAGDIKIGGSSYDDAEAKTVSTTDHRHSWNELKNRPFYESDSCTVGSYLGGYIQAGSNGIKTARLYDVDLTMLEPGATYHITFLEQDSPYAEIASYDWVVKEWDSTSNDPYYVGNPIIYADSGSLGEDSGEPAVLYTRDGAAYMAIDTRRDPLTAITGLLNVVISKDAGLKTLDEKYIPDSIARTVHTHNWMDVGSKTYECNGYVIVEPTTFESNGDYMENVFNTFEIINGEVYTVLFDGVEYTTTAVDNGIDITDVFWVGNGYDNTNGTYCAAGTHTVSIYKGYVQATICEDVIIYPYDNYDDIEWLETDVLMSDGETYVVTWDDVEYICLARRDGESVFIGRQSLMKEHGFSVNLPDIGNEPFVIYTTDSGGLGVLRNNQSHTVTVKRATKRVDYFMPVKYLPAHTHTIEDVFELGVNKEIMLEENTATLRSGDLKQYSDWMEISVLPSHGDICIVTWQGEEYETVAYLEEDRGRIYVGNRHFYSDAEDTGEPFLFLIDAEDYEYRIYTHDELTECTYKAWVQRKAIHPKYIPDTIARKSDLANAMPSVTTADNGKFLRVVDGVWAATTVPRAEDLEV